MIMELNSIKYHTTLANYFAAQPLFFDGELQKKPHVRKCMEQPWQQTKAELWDEVTETLCDLDFIQAKACAKQTYDLVKDYHFALDGLPEYQPEKEKERKRQELLNKYTKDLINYSNFWNKEYIYINKIIQSLKKYSKKNQLEIPKSITPWTQEQIDAEIERIKSYPTRADKLKDFINFLGQEANNLQKYTCEFAFFTYQQAWNYAAEGFVGEAAEKLPLDYIKYVIRRIPANRPIWNPLPKALKTIKGHISDINSIDISLDGKTAISGSKDHTCIQWDLQSGALIKKLEGHTSDVDAVAISADGKIAISGSLDSTCILWNLQSGKQIRILKGHKAGVNAIAISPNGKTAISGSKDHICILWNLQKGTILRTLKGHTKEVSSVAISPDGKTAISGSWDNTCILWDLQSGMHIKTLEGHKDSVSSVAVSPDGKTAISGSFDKTCILWDLQNGTPMKTLNNHRFWVNAVAISPDGKTALSASDLSCVFWDLQKGSTIKILQGHTNDVDAIAISPDGKIAITGSSDKTCILWDLQKGTSIQSFIGHTRKISTIAISHDGKTAITGSSDKTCILWNIQNDIPLKTLKKHVDWVNSVAISPNENIAYSSSSDRTIILWNLHKNSFIKKYKLQEFIASNIAISPDGKIAFAGSIGKTCILWDLQSGAPIKIFEGHNMSVVAVDISPDGKTAISGSRDKTCILWDLQSGIPIKTLKGHSGSITSVAFCPDGKAALSGSMDTTCILWDLQSGMQIKKLTGHENGVNSIAISPDGKTVISGSWDKTCLFWNLTSGQKLPWLFMNSGFNSIIFSINKIIFCGDSDVMTTVNTSKELLCPDIPLCTIKTIWKFDPHESQYLYIDCPLCGNRFESPSTVLDTIDIIKIKYALNLGDLPCMKLPKEAWFEPGLLCNCPQCGEKLRFNPFIAGEIESYIKHIWNGAQQLIKESEITKERTQRIKPLNYYLLERNKEKLESLAMLLEQFQETWEKQNLEIELEIMPPKEKRDKAFMYYEFGEYLNAKFLLENLLKEGFAVLSTHIHLMCIAIMMDDIDDADKHLNKIIKMQDNAENYLSARILWMQLLLIFLNAINKENIVPLLGQIKYLLQREDTLMEWNMEPVLEHIKTKVSDSQFALLSSLVRALRTGNTNELENIKEWQSAIPLKI